MPSGDERYVSIGKAARMLGVSTSTLRRWARMGVLVPRYRTPGGRWRYDRGSWRPSRA